MPIYEYTCDGCGHHFEELIRSSKEERKVACPKCSGNHVARRLSVFAARQGNPTSASPGPMGGGCGRCGDPHGPCSLD